MKASNSMKYVFTCLLLFSLSSLADEILFYEDMESPNVASYSEGTRPPNWVGATGGFGATRHGLTDEFTGDFISEDPSTNHQAIAFRYTNSGMTTGAGQVGNGNTFILNTTYTIEFDVMADFGRVGFTDTYYNVSFMLFSNGVSRTDCRSTPSGAKVLASRTGNVSTSGATTHVTFTYNPHLTNDVGWVDTDLTIRLKGATSSACIDNIVVSWIPPPPEGTVFTFR